MKNVRWIAVLAAALWSAPAVAADHLDSPSVTEDATTDITDLFVFLSPNDANKVVLIMAVHPLAGADASFSDAASYNFHVNNADGMNMVSCTFADGNVSCDAGNGVSASGPVGQRNDGDSISVWAGLADDPFFFDLAAFQNVIGANEEANAFCLLDPDNGGNGDFFAGLNVLGLVVEVNKEVLLGGDDTTLQVWASTNRIGG